MKAETKLFFEACIIACTMGETGSLETVGRLMSALRGGEHDAAGQLVDLLYPELRRLAAVRMARERSDHSFQPTVLVHELYLDLIRMKAFPGGEDNSSSEEKAIFLRLAGRMMERRLIDHARPLSRRLPKVGLTEAELASSGSGEETLLHIESLLAGLAKINPKFRTVVEFKVFMGMTLEEIARDLGCSSRTTATYWSFARNWLANKLDGGAPA
jgi:RNA polymerase sigma factor (TIGR02999 family)